MIDAVSGYHRGRAVLFALATGRFRYAALLIVMATSSQPSLPTLVKMSVSLRLAEAPPKSILVYSHCCIKLAHVGCAGETAIVVCEALLRTPVLPCG